MAIWKSRFKPTTMTACQDRLSRKEELLKNYFHDYFCIATILDDHYLPGLLDVLNNIYATITGWNQISEHAIPLVEKFSLHESLELPFTHVKLCCSSSSGEVSAPLIRPLSIYC